MLPHFADHSKHQLAFGSKSGIMKYRKIEVAEHHRVDALEEIAWLFFEEILGMDYSEILITDESSLRDFVGCGEDCADFPHHLSRESLPREEYVRLWSEWAITKIKARWEIATPDTKRLFRLFLQIQSAQNQRVQ